MARETLRTHPYFNENFQIHTDASAFRLGAVISHKDKNVDFYSRKLTDAQTRYIVTEKGLLSVIENLKEFITIILGQKLRIYTDLRNLTLKMLNTDTVLR